MKPRLLWKALQVLRSPFIGSDCLLDQKGLFKARNAGYGSWLWKKGISQAQKVFEGFKDLGSTSIIHQLFINSLSLIVIIEKVTCNLVNFEYQNSLNIGHNVNPTFPLMNSQSNLLKTLRLFHRHTKRHETQIFFF